MDEVQEAIAPVEAEAPIETAVDETENLEALAKAEREEVPEEPEAPAEEEEIPAPVVEDEFEEFDWNGKQIKAPKGLKDGVLMHADYTKKTQEVAAQRKELEERQHWLAQQAEASEQELGQRAKLHHLNDQLSQYENVDWDAWEAQAPLDAQQGFRQFQMLKEQRGGLVNELAKQQYERGVQQQQSDAKRLEDTEKFARTIPGWTPEVGKKVADFAATKGMDLKVLEQVVNPQFYDILYKAWYGEQALSKNIVPKPQAPQKPLTLVSSKSNAPVRKSLAEMSMEEYAAARKAGQKR